MIRELAILGALGALGYALYTYANEVTGDEVDPALADALQRVSLTGDTPFQISDYNTNNYSTGPLTVSPTVVSTPTVVSAPATSTASDELDIFARTLWGEARGESDAAIQAVANVIINRVNDDKGRFPTTIAGVCQQPNQFSVWNTGGTANELANHNAMLAVTTSNTVFLKCLSIAQNAMNGSLVDNTGGAEWYHDTSISKPASWSNLTRTVQIGHLVFYKG